MLLRSRGCPVRRGRLVSADVHVGDYPTVEAVRWISTELERQTAGRLRLKLFHSGQLGRESDTVELVRNGVIDLTRVHISVMANAVPASRVLALPYLIESTAHLRRAVDGEPGRGGARFDGRAGPRGPCDLRWRARCIYNMRRPVSFPHELAGLKLRVPPSDLFIDMTRALGANATPLSYGETFAALQTGPDRRGGEQLAQLPVEPSLRVGALLVRYAALLCAGPAADVRRRLGLLAQGDQELLRELAQQSVARCASSGMQRRCGRAKPCWLPVSNELKSTSRPFARRPPRLSVAARRTRRSRG